MTIAIVTLVSDSPYIQSKPHTSPKKPKELAADYEERTWREKAHVNEKGHVYIPAAALTKSLHNAAQLMKEKIPGKGNSTYSVHFRVGTLVNEHVDLGIKIEDVACSEIFCSADGKKTGQGTRVIRKFPTINKWRATVAYHIIDPIITKDIFLTCLKTAGVFNGIGAFRPESNGGWNGRYMVEDCDWQA
jgi:hypothetical protein